MMQKMAVSTFLKGLLHRAGISVHKALFRHMVKSGLVLCAVAPVEEEHVAAPAAEVEQVQTGDETGTAAENEPAPAAAQGTEDEEVVITIGEEEPPASNEEETNEPAPQWVKELRKSDREKAKRIRELEQQLTASQPGKQAPAEMAKPTLAGCDYDEDAYESKLTEWHANQAAIKAQQQEQADAEKKARDDWNARLAAYNTAKTGLKVDDYEGAEAVVLETLNQTQQAIIVNGAENPAHVIYALGKNPAKAKELASIKDPVKYAFAVAKLETQLKVTPRKAPPAPERVVRGNAPAVGVTDSKLASLEAEADRTGDRSKVIAYRREQRRSQA